jgi:signal peptidase I
MARALIRRLPFLLAVAAFAGWYLLLAPTSIGGPASYVWVSGDSMEPTLHTGDFVVLRRADGYQTGEVVAFRVPAGEPAAGAFVIHRIVGGAADAGFITQGDNKDRPDRWRPRDSDVLGTQVWAWSGGGRVIGWLRDPAIFASVAAGLTVFVVMLGGFDAPYSRPNTRHLVDRLRRGAGGAST